MWGILKDDTTDVSKKNELKSSLRKTEETKGYFHESIAFPDPAQ